MTDHFIVNNGSITHAPQTTRQRLWGRIATGATVALIAGGAMLLNSPDAKADDKLDNLAKGDSGNTVCEILYASGINMPTIMRIGEIVVNPNGHPSGYTYQEAGGFIGLAVATHCPSLLPQVLSFAENYAANSAGVNRKTA